MKPRQRQLSLGSIPPEHRAWMSEVIRMLNDVATDHYHLLNGGLTQDNLRTVTKTVQWSGKALSIAHGLPQGSVPVQVQVAQCLDTKNNPISVSVPAWTVQGDQIQVSSIGGTVAGTVYNVVLIIHGS